MLREMNYININKGEYQVPFVFHKDKKRTPEQISMANDAFYHPAILVITKDSGYLSLRTKQMEQKSLIDKVRLAGKVEKIKYEYQNHVKEAIISDTMVKLPIEALKFIYIKEDDILHRYVKLYDDLHSGCDTYAGKHSYFNHIFINNLEHLCLSSDDRDVFGVNEC